MNRAGRELQTEPAFAKNSACAISSWPRSYASSAPPGWASPPNSDAPKPSFWLVAIALFYLPLAAVVIYLNRLMPLEGGLYQWAKEGFGEMAGFLTAWNLWVYAIVSTGAIVFVIPTDISYMMGPSAAWIPASKLATLALTGAVMVAIAWWPIRGLDIGKWLHNIGSILILLAYAILLALPLWALWRGRIHTTSPSRGRCPSSIGSASPSSAR